MWESVFQQYTEDEVLELRMEFTTLSLDFCLSVPYRFKSRVAFCATQLCYPKGLAEKLFSKDVIRSENKMNLSTLDAVSHHWVAGKPLVEALSKVDDEDYRVSTADYRNKAQHRHPQRLDWGHTSAVARSFPEDALVAYSFGVTAPLLTAVVLPILVSESERMRSSFEAYRILVEEHIHGKGET